MALIRFLAAATLIGALAVSPAASVSAAERTQAATLVCQSGEQDWLTTTLFFGRSIQSGGTVSDVEWLSFLSAEIIPRFPDGFTVSDAQGFWRGSTGDTKVERTKMLIVAHPPKGAAEELFDEIIDAYKERFKQKSVLKTVARTCVRF